MGFLFTTALVLASVAAVPVAGAYACRSAVARREEAQSQIAAGVSHLSPSHSWTVAYASASYMEALFKFWSWEDVGVLHIYEEALAFYGETKDFEVGREELAAVRLTTYIRTNPLVPWIEIETTGGVRYYFCVPKGMHVFGMKNRANDLYSALDQWSKGSSGRPLRIGE